MLKKIIIGVIGMATLASLIAWRVDWTINDAKIKLIENQKAWVRTIEETEGKDENFWGTNYKYPEFNISLRDGINGTYKIEITKGVWLDANPEDKHYDIVTETITVNGHYNWIDGEWEGTFHRI